MKKILLFFLLISASVLHGQILKIPYLINKGMADGAIKVHIENFEFVENKGLTLTRTDIETYDTKGRLEQIERTDHASALAYSYTYALNKKGRITQEKIVNAKNNQTVRTTDYRYKKGFLERTTQVQGTVTTIKTYTHNKGGYLTGLKVEENGTLKGEEIYLVDEQGRRTRNSQKLAGAEVATVISIFNYAEKNGHEVKSEIRSVNGVQYEIITEKDLVSERNLKETTKNLSNSQSGFNQITYQNDERGSWTKAEVIDNQFGRSKLILREITYADGTKTGRIEMNPEDDRVRYNRQYQQYQLLLNGRLITGSTPVYLPDTDDRLVYAKEQEVSIILKGYDKKSRQTTWHEAEIISHAPGDVFWATEGEDVHVFYKGEKLARSTYTTSNPYAIYKVNNTAAVHVFKDVKKGFIAKSINSEEFKGTLQKAEFRESPYVWAKASDTTYVLVGYGSSVNIKRQTEDKQGNKLVNAVANDYWYAIPNFRKAFENGEVGDMHAAFYLTSPIEELKEKELFKADFSSFKYDKLKNKRYRLKTVNDEIVTNIATASTKTSDDQLITYFPLTKEYLRIEDYYTLPDDKETNDQSVTALSKGMDDIYYIYGEGKNIDFYKSGVEVGGHNFGVHQLSNDAAEYGAVLYDSASKNSYGMNYDLTLGDGVGAMNKLPYNSSKAYLLKLKSGQWVVFEYGVKVTDYAYSAVDEGAAYYFFKDKTSGEAKGYKFIGYEKAKSGDFIDASLLSGKYATEAASRLNIDPLKAPPETPKEKANSFKKDGDSYWLWDANGSPVNNYLEWLGSLGTKDVFVQDTTLKITYQLIGYMNSEKLEGDARVVVRPDQHAVIKWEESNLAFMLAGEITSDVKRIYLNNQPNAETWTELVYNPASRQTYLMSYPSKTGFYLGMGEQLPTDDTAMILTKMSKGQFSVIVHGRLHQEESFKSGGYEGDLIYWAEGHAKGVEAYRFRGFIKGDVYDLFYPEVISESELNAIRDKIETYAKPKGG